MPVASVYLVVLRLHQVGLAFVPVASVYLVVLRLNQVGLACCAKYAGFAPVLLYWLATNAWLALHTVNYIIEGTAHWKAYTWGSSV